MGNVLSPMHYSSRMREVRLDDVHTRGFERLLEFPPENIRSPVAIGIEVWAASP